MDHPAHRAADQRRHRRDRQQHRLPVSTFRERRKRAVAHRSPGQLGDPWAGRRDDDYAAGADWSMMARVIRPWPTASSSTSGSRPGRVRSAVAGSRGYGQASGQNAATRLEEATDRLIQELRLSNRNMRVIRNREALQVDGGRALSTYLSNDSPVGGRETDWLVTMAHADGLLFMVFTAPEREVQIYESTFQADAALRQNQAVSRECSRRAEARRLPAPITRKRPLIRVELVEIPDVAEGSAHLLDGFHVLERRLQRFRGGAHRLHGGVTRLLG